MSDQTTNALLAIALGSVAAVVLLIPVAAVQYRLDGRLGPGDLATLVTAAVYGLAIWTYTLLPVPARHGYRCKGSQLRLLGSLGLIHYPHHGGPADLLREPAFLQIVLNVLLFVPLGWFVRVVAHRGVVAATVLGLGVSLLVEFTQRTGDWHVYPCAYRLFDVDDILVNTLGATVGSLVSRLVLPHRRGHIVLPTTISFGRRLVGFVCDVLFVTMIAAVVGLAWRGWQLYVLHHHPGHLHPHLQNLLQWSVPLLIESALVLLAGRTVGELVVSVRAVPRRGKLLVPGRVVKLAAGVGPLFVLAILPPAYAAALVVPYAVLTVVVAWRTVDHRGLSHTLAHMDLRIG